MRRTLKKTVAVGLAAATAFSLCACGGSGDGSKSGSKDALEVVIWDNNQQKGLQQICDLFTEETGIKVDVQVKEWDSYWTLLEAGASGGDMPDVFWMHSNNSQMYMKNNKLLKLDDYIEKSDKVDMSNYMSEITELYTYDGSYYAVPKDYDTIALWYNKKMFDDSEDCRLTQGFVSYVGEENLPGRVTFDNNAFFNLANNSDYKNSYYMKVLAYLEADTAQAVLCQYDNLIGLAKSGRLADLSDEKVGDIYDKYKDRIIYYEDEEGKKIPVGIDVSEGYKAAGLTEYTDGKAYIGLSAYAADYGYVEKFVDYMVELGIQSGGAGCR